MSTSLRGAAALQQLAEWQEEAKVVEVHVDRAEGHFRLLFGRLQDNRYFLGSTERGNEFCCWVPVEGAQELWQSAYVQLEVLRMAVNPDPRAISWCRLTPALNVLRQQLITEFGVSVEDDSDASFEQFLSNARVEKPRS